MNVSVSGDLFSDFLKCKYKAYLKLNDKSGQIADFERQHIRLLEEYRNGAEEHLLQLHRKPDVSRRPSSLAYAIKHGYDVITNAYATIANMSCHYDALLRVADSSPLPNPEYIPFLFLYTEKISKLDKLLLTFCGLVLEQIQGRPVRFGKIVHGSQFVTNKVQLAKLYTTANQTVRDITCIYSDPPPLRLNGHCSICEFKEQCNTVALERDNLSLLRGVTEKEIIKLNRKGIFTVTQYSYTFRPRRRRKKAAKHSPRHHHSLQALAIRTNTIYVAERPKVPSTATRLYLDLEGVPDRDFYYLIGLLICTGETKDYLPRWADNKEHEAAIWHSFLDTIGALNDFTIFHYGNYDRQALKQLQKRYGGSRDLLDKLLSDSVNVLAAIYAHVYFPTYSNGLKSIASHLGFQWSEKEASGTQALVWRQQWEETKDRNAREKLITYNHEDCLALKAVVNVLERIDADDASSNTVHINDIVTESNWHFGKHEFFFPELRRVNQYAYFDYQRSRVYAHTNPAVKRSLQRKQRLCRSTIRINKEIQCERPAQCPKCGKVKPQINSHCSRVVYDLKLTNSGIKKWVVRYSASRYLCTQCNTNFLPRSYPLATSSKYGPALIAWSVYQIIFLHNSYNSIAEQSLELFGFPLDRLTVARFKKVAADYYESTYIKLGDRLRSGSLVHADETKVSIKGVTGYVWVFTNLEDVMYVYTDSREGSIVQKVLDGFTGVLISDFYSAYDSVNCVQQKCLIHLMRDINNDLFKNPFDEELKQLGREFTAVLVPIVETVDRYGLKRRHLNKHRAKVERFLNFVVSQDYRSDVARSYQKRFGKYRCKLFRFLEYDGIPWNNNNAEHAVKRFAILRRSLGGSSTPSGIQKYLVLLSICETLRRKNVSFLQFLLSRTTDIDSFVERRYTRNRQHISDVPHEENIRPPFRSV